jgi:hypothetical protein
MMKWIVPAWQRALVLIKGTGSAFRWFVTGSAGLILCAFMNDHGLYHSVASVIMVLSMVVLVVAGVKAVVAISGW